MGVAIKGQHGNPYGDGHVLYIHCINVSILVVILYSAFWEKVVKGA